MRRTMKTMMATAAVLTIALFTGSTALADSTADYREAMDPFLPTVVAWADEAVPLVRATDVKPKVACSDEMAALAQRGVWLSQDLAGTGQSAPDGLQAEHEALADAFDGLVTATQGACADPAAARLALNAEMDQYESALRKIQIFLTGLHMERPGQTPGLPVTGN